MAQNTAIAKLTKFAENSEGTTHLIFTVEEARLIVEYISELRACAGTVSSGPSFADIRKSVSG